jgi:hypothetical protein
MTRALEQLVGRTGPGLAEACAWLECEVRVHPLLQEQHPDAGEIRRNLLALARRIGAGRPGTPHEAAPEAEDR